MGSAIAQRVEYNSAACTSFVGATYLTANPVFHARTRHIEVDFHFVREKVALGALEVRFISSEDQIADAFTMPSTKLMLQRLRTNLNH